MRVLSLFIICQFVFINDALRPIRKLASKQSFNTKYNHYRITRLKCTSEDQQNNENNEDLNIDKDNKQTDIIKTGKYGLWLDFSSITKQFNLPNLIGGTVFGMFITLFGLFGPFFFQEYESSHSTTTTSITKSNNNIEKSITLFEDILIDLKNGYVEELNSDKLFETAMNAMLKSLDPYTEYENLKESKLMQESVSGKYGGVGMIISGMYMYTVYSILV